MLSIMLQPSDIKIGSGRLRTASVNIPNSNLLGGENEDLKTVEEKAKLSLHMFLMITENKLLAQQH